MVLPRGNGALRYHAFFRFGHNGGNHIRQPVTQVANIGIRAIAAQADHAFHCIRVAQVNGHPE